MAAYCPYAYRGALPPSAPVPHVPVDSSAVEPGMQAVWKDIFQPKPIERLLIECKCNVMDFRTGVVDGHVFVSTNYVAFLLSGGANAGGRKSPVCIPLAHVTSWVRAAKVLTPGVAPFVRITSPVKPGERAAALHFYTVDDRLHMLFDLGAAYDRFCYLFDVAWRAHHPNVPQHPPNALAQAAAAVAGTPLPPPSPLQSQQQQQQSMATTGMFPGTGGAPGFMTPMQMAALQQQMLAMSRGMQPSSGSPAPPPHMFHGVPPPQGSPINATQPGQFMRMAPPAFASTLPPVPQGTPPVSQQQYQQLYQQHQQQPRPQPSHPAVTPPTPPTAKVPTPPTSASPPASRDTALPMASVPSEAPPSFDTSETQLAGFKVVDGGRPSLQSQQDPDAAFLASTTPATWAEMPVAVSPGTKLSFGLGSRQAPVDHEVSETITITNNSTHKQSFRLVSKPTDKAKFRFEPSAEGKIAAGKSATVEIKLTVLCTSAQLRLEISLVAWRGDAEKAKRKLAAPLTSEMESQLTTKLDSDELTIFTPPIGDGSFGTVYRGEYRGLEVAIKLLKFQQAISSDMMEGFKSEVEMMEKLRHPCIINFIGAVHTPGHMAIITEFCSFGNLNSAMKKHQFSLALKLKCLVDSARGMDFLHRSSILHRDLKPDNLLMTSLEVRAGVVCKISDFGTTRDMNRFAAEMHFTKGVGTPIFMAPEMLEGKSSYERSADVYSFGLMMANIADEKMPFEGDPEIKSSWQFASLVIAGKRPVLAAVMPDEYVQLMTRCWSAKPAERPSFSDIVPKIDAMFKRELAKAQQKKS